MNQLLTHTGLGTVLLLSFSAYSNGQSTAPNPAPGQKDDNVVVLSGIATTARIADPNERVVFNGQVMRMADFVAEVSSNNEAAQRLRNLEKQNSSSSPQVAPESKKRSDSPSPVVAPAAGSASTPAAAPEKH